MLEQFLSELKVPLNTINLLIKVLKQHYEQDLNIFSEESEKEYKTNQYALMYSLKLVSDDLIRLSDEYYINMKEEKYQCIGDN